MALKEIEFYKYQGAGDDFIVIDNRDGRYSEFLASSELTWKMCLRHFGVDTDGIVEVALSKDKTLEFVWHTCLGIINTMCGNGCRVFASFVKISGIHAGTDDVKFLAGDGMHYGNYDPETREGSATFKDIAVSSVEKLSENEYFVDTGVPHMVVFVDYDVSKIDDAYVYGKELREKWEPKYRTKTSYLIVEWVQEVDGVFHSRCCDGNLGKEPIACGTGTTAIGVCQAFRSGCPVNSDFEAQIQWPGGLMKCLLHRDTDTFSKIRISGQVRQVFKGTFYTDSME